MLLATVLGLDAKTWEAEDIPMVHLTDARRYVCDPDEILSQTERDSIDSYLLRLDKQCGVESVFVIVKRVSNGDTFRFAQDLGNRQGVGSKKTNRGLVVVVAVEDRRYFIAPGEGLEKDLTDIECDDIGRACIVANMKRGEPGQAVLATAQAVYKKLKTGTTGIQENTDEDAGAGLAIVLFTVICIVVVLVILNRRDNRGKGGGGGGGYDLVHPVGHHRPQQGGGAAQVVVVILQGVFHRLAHLRGGGEVDDAVDVLGLEQLVHGRPVPDVRLIEAGLGVDGGPEAGEQVVGHHHVPSGLDELVHSVGTDISGSAQNKNCHSFFHPSCVGAERPQIQ
mgnify:CR=1 FL=1